MPTKLSVVILAALSFISVNSVAERRCVAPTPPMGWNAWNCFGGEVSEEKINAIADAMVASGMKDAGYQYVVIDDVWHQGRVKGFSFASQEEKSGRDENGVLLADPVLQLLDGPAGVDDLACLLHSLLKVRGMIGDAEQGGGVEADDIPPRPMLSAA